MSNRDYEAQHQVYREFKEFVSREFPDERRLNPDMNIVTFDEMPKPGVKTLEIPFKNISQINDVIEFGRKVASFAPGSRLESNVGVSTGLMKYTAYVRKTSFSFDLHLALTKFRSHGKTDDHPLALVMMMNARHWRHQARPDWCCGTWFSLDWESLHGEQRHGQNGWHLQGPLA